MYAYMTTAVYRPDESTTAARGSTIADAQWFAAELNRLLAERDEARRALEIMYDNMKMALTAMDRCGLTAMADGIRADIITEPCVSAIAAAQVDSAARCTPPATEAANG